MYTTVFLYSAVFFYSTVRTKIQPSSTLKITKSGSTFTLQNPEIRLSQKKPFPDKPNERERIMAQAMIAKRKLFAPTICEADCMHLIPA